MPLYEVSHCIPLSQQQKDALAECITDAHATAFITPKLFVNVVFDQPGPTGMIYVAGKPRGQTIPNHIRATVRAGPSRTKEEFDKVALKIQSRWYEVVNDATLGAQSFEGLPAKDQERIKKLQAIAFCPALAAMENGYIMPAPGDEAAWFKENMAYFQERVNVEGDEDIKDMLKEVSEREDMKSFVA